MDTSKLKPFAQEARRTLKAQVSARLDLVLAEQSAARREQPKAVAELEAEIARTDREQVVERVAYTWFNRFTALRFMDANDYTRLKVVSPAEGQTRPEILAEAAAGHIDEELPPGVREKVAALLDGRTPSADAQGEAYRLLLVAACNQWHAPMPFMFEKIADYTELLLPEGLLSADSLLAKARAVMTEDACQDVEIIGWLYQFYISEKKEEVFAGLKKNVKITAENIPAATQLFTPHWIVRYLVENSLGRLWLLNRPGSKLAERMDYYIAPEDPETDFMRIAKPEDIRICDPACGSGHMLTYAFDLLYAIYEEEGYEATEIPGLILTHNLYGIEIDDRAGALAAFALAMKAATKLGRRRFLRMEVKPSIVVLQNVTFTQAEMTEVAAVVGRDLFTGELRETLTQFEQAKNFGSLIVPKLRDPAETLRVVEARDVGGDLLLKEVQDRVVGVLRMAEALSPKYHVVVANPPYMGSKGMNDRLKAFLSDNYKPGKSDAMAAFIYRSQSLAIQKGICAIITLDSWMFLSSYNQLRADTLSKARIANLLHIGWNCFPEGHAYNRGVAFVLGKSDLSKAGEFLDLSDVPAVIDKHHLFKERKRSRRNLRIRTSDDFSALPEMPLAFAMSASLIRAFKDNPKFSDEFTVRQGLATTDNGRFLRLWSEVSKSNIGFGYTDQSETEVGRHQWFPYNKGGEFRKWYGNQTFLVNWRNDGADIKEEIVKKYPYLNGNPNFVAKNQQFYFRESVSFSKVGSGLPSFRHYPKGFIFDVAGSSMFPESRSHIRQVVAFFNTRVAREILERLSPTLNIEIQQINSFPMMVRARWVSLESASDELLALSRADWDAYETSWDFASLPLLSLDHRAETLEATYARLRAHWQSMTEEMQRLEVENNRIFIDAYGLQDELTPEVPLEEITLSCNPSYRYGGKKSDAELEELLLADTMREFVSYAVGCMFGRYSLDEPGLILANQGEGLANYLAHVPLPSFEPDSDNVIPVIEGDWFADDVTERFRKFLRVTFGDERFAENLAFIEDALGKDLRRYFTRDFFNDHVKRYRKRPIYWMFSSPKGSFQALIYMHRYRPDTVSVVLNDYLREFRNKLEAHRKGLETLSVSTEATPVQRTKAIKEVGEVTKVIEELDGYERDVLYPLATQKIEIDFDDGVKANYPKFGAALKPIKGLSDADD